MVTIIFIPGTTNLADGLTKATSGREIQLLLTENKRAMAPKEGQKERMFRAAAEKQYLLADQDYENRKLKISEQAKEKFGAK